MKTRIVLAIILLFTGAIDTANALMFNGHDYVIITYENQDWDSANDHLATTLGSDYHLATIDSSSEQEFIVTLMGSLSGEYWVGGYQDEDENWNWVTEDSWSYTNWGEGEANDYYGAGSEQYLAIWSKYDGWGWNDEGAIGNITGYIAESTITPVFGQGNAVDTIGNTAESAPAPVPEPGTLLLIGSGLLGMVSIGRKKIHAKDS